jgi:hypothetical protein
MVPRNYLLRESSQEREQWQGRAWPIAYFQRDISFHRHVATSFGRRYSIEEDRMISEKMADVFDVSSQQTDLIVAGFPLPCISYQEIIRTSHVPPPTNETLFFSGAVHVRSTDLVIPYTVSHVPLFANCLAFILAACGITQLKKLLLQSRRRRMSLCVHCGYSNTNNICPECGFGKL